MTVTRRAALILPLSCCLAIVPAPGQAATAGSGQSATETRTVAEFQAIALSGAIDLVVRQGPQPSLQVQADDKLLGALETVVESTRHGPTLQVRWKKGENIRARSKVLVTVVMPRLTSLLASDAGDIRLEPFTTPALSVSLSGSGDARLDGLNTEELEVRISGNGDLAGSGKAARLKVSIAGSGDVHLADLRSDEVSVRIAGSGSAAVDANKTLDIRIAGSGDVTYTGNATLRSTLAGSGSVTKK